MKQDEAKPDVSASMLSKKKSGQLDSIVESQKSANDAGYEDMAEKLYFQDNLVLMEDLI